MAELSTSQNSLRRRLLSHSVGKSGRDARGYFLSPACGREGAHSRRREWKGKDRRLRRRRLFLRRAGRRLAVAGRSGAEGYDEAALGPALRRALRHRPRLARLLLAAPRPAVDAVGRAGERRAAVLEGVVDLAVARVFRAFGEGAGFRLLLAGVVARVGIGGAVLAEGERTPGALGGGRRSQSGDERPHERGET